MLIECTGIKKSYETKEVLNGLSFTLSEGESLSIYGDSGAGKTTILNILALMQQFNQGDYFLLGENANSFRNKKRMLHRRNTLSYVFQNFGLIDDSDINGNLDIALKYSNLSKKDAEKSKDKILDKVGIKYKKNKKIIELSGGEKQRVALARAFLKPSKIILADEPTGSLDSKNRDLVMNLLDEEKKEGKGLIIVTHDPTVINNCDKKLCLDGGNNCE
ncbi:ATP-binding cassette domain-containing protein [Enterococcus gilvus]|uniref:ATP-binding cassette domain-containing protein n=1 Tax=Enterococcus gilvus TaxID=160453 RepID=UPI003D6B0FB3